MQYRFKINNMRDGGNFKKVLCTMLLLCPLSMACAASQQAEMQTIENQNNISEVELRIASLEKRLADLDGSAQPTGANSQAVPKASVVPPVAHVSPISNPQGVPATVAPVAATPMAPAVATPIQAAPAPQATPAPQVNQRAPLGVLDPSSRMEGVQVKQAEPNPSPALSLPPESAMYPPSEGVASNNIVPAVNTNAQAMPANTTQQAVVQPIATAQVPQAQPIQPVAQPKAVSGEQAAYKEALDLVLGGKYATGRDKFNAFLQQYPNGRLAPNAYYWIGESFYAQKNYSEALLSFKQVTSGYPKHHKTPDALLKAGMTYDKLGDKENASLQYRALLADFPNSSAAKIARNKKY